jgi:L-lactate utilization protein LutC
MESERILSYEERMKERKKIVMEIDKTKTNLKKLNAKMINIKKELERCETEKLELENKIKNLLEEYISKGIPVPSNGNFEILNGLVGAKRDINLKLIKGMKDDEIKQVFSIIYLFIYLLL